MSFQQVNPFSDAMELTELIRHFDWLDSELYYIIKNESNKKNVDFYMVLCIVDIESNGNKNAFNRNRNLTADYGLMQINSSHSESVKDFTVQQNIEFGVCYFSKCLNSSDSIFEAIGKYNAGINSKFINIQYVNKILNKYGKIRNDKMHCM
jgi:soluble lytic murein transglycosylase-like protein